MHRQLRNNTPATVTSAGMAAKKLQALRILPTFVGWSFNCPNTGRPMQSRRNQLTPVRSEEHTSELQSLMRISYAVFCLKKKKQKDHNTYYNNNHHIPKTK